MLKSTLNIANVETLPPKLHDELFTLRRDYLKKISYAVVIIQAHFTVVQTHA
jgi:hypothetical protein